MLFVRFVYVTGPNLSLQCARQILVPYYNQRDCKGGFYFGLILWVDIMGLVFSGTKGVFNGSGALNPYRLSAVRCNSDISTLKVFRVSTTHYV